MEGSWRGWCRAGGEGGGVAGYQKKDQIIKNKVIGFFSRFL